jgi:hypothetical protein
MVNIENNTPTTNAERMREQWGFITLSMQNVKAVGRTIEEFNVINDTIAFRNFS